MAAARATWTGSIQFGMVNCPVKLFTATDSDKQVKFNQINSKTGNRVSQKRVDAETGEEVEYSDIVKGYEIRKDEYVILSEDEIAELLPDKSSAIEIISFVDEEDVDPIYYNKPYYIAPNETDKPYALLAKALKDTERIAIGRFVMRSNQYACVIRPVGDGLCLNTLYWPDQVRAIDSIVNVDEVKIEDREIQMASSLIESMSDNEFALEDLRDDYREQVMELITAKDEGKEIVVSQTKKAAPTDDLFSILEESLKAAEAKKEAV